MPEVAQYPGGNRLPRLLARVLVLAGATVGGVSLVWLLATGTALAGQRCAGTVECVTSAVLGEVTADLGSRSEPDTAERTSCAERGSSAAPGATAGSESAVESGSGTAADSRPFAGTTNSAGHQAAADQWAAAGHDSASVEPEVSAASPEAATGSCAERETSAEAKKPTSEEAAVGSHADSGRLLAGITGDGAPVDRMLEPLTGDRSLTGHLDKLLRNAEPVLRPVGDTVSAVGDAAETVLSGVRGQRSLPEAVGAGLDELDDPLHELLPRESGDLLPGGTQPTPALPGADDTPVRPEHEHPSIPGTGAVPGTGAAPTPPASPEPDAKPAAVHTEHQQSREITTGETFRPVPPQQEHHSRHPVDHLPPAAPFSAAGTSTTEANGSSAGSGSGVALGGHRISQRPATAAAIRAASTSPASAAGGLRPQPGTTPD